MIVLAAVDDVSHEQPQEINQPSMPAVVDWLVPIALGLLGIIGLFVGVALFAVADPGVIADLVEQGTVEGDLFGPDEVVGVMVDTIWWGALGLVIAGVSFLAAAIYYVLHRRRERAATRSDGRDRGLITNSMVGGVTALVLSFVPFAQAIGGIVSGYLHAGSRSDSVLAGAVSGFIASVPFIVIAVFFLVGLIMGAMGTSEPNVGSVFGAIMVVVVLIGLLYAVGLGALGGLIGSEL